ncbi:MAG: hypothetical protein IPN92_19560 [Chromatiaceae bacterium]|nr:hypothetical protein [Chromatiaceae bacterium]
MTSRDTCARKALRLLTIFIALLLPLAIVPILAGWVGDIIKDWISGASPFPSHLGLLIASFTLLLAAAAWVVWKGRRLLPTRVLVQSPSFEQRQVVIALLSPCDDLQRGDDGNWEVKGQDRAWVSLKDKDLDQLVSKNLGLQWKWQQTLRAAHYHATRLQLLVLVGSAGARGSGTQDQLNLAKVFLSTWFPGKVMVYGEPQTPDGAYDTRWQADFEDLEGLERLLRNILRELHRDTASFTDADIVIDCTGGFKVASIAAAMVTLDRPQLMFQYVGTGEHAGQVIGFDVSTEHYGT